MTNEITYLKFCSSCQDDRGHSKPILEKDVKHARRRKDGSWVCGVCVLKELLELNGGYKIK
jgi:hypothetical protein